MARQKRKSVTVKLDLTPMIDVVFQLIIFFILIMQVSQIDIKNVQLPLSVNTKEDITKTKKIFVLHMFHPDGGGANATNAALPHEKWYITVPRIDTPFTEVEDLAPKLQEQANNDPAGVNERGNSEMEILVRGDMRAPSHYFSVIMAACIKARVYKIKVSVLAPRDQ